MSWLEDSADTVTETKVDDKWLKIPEPQLGKTTEVKLRILDDEPVGVWRHWQDGRPYNCPGIATCPVCKVRMEAKRVDPEGYRKEYRMDYRYYFNVIVDGKVKIFSFSSSLGRKLKMFMEKYGDLRDYEVTIQKRKTGPLPMNVEYDAFYEGKSAMSDEDAITSETKFELGEYIVPSRSEDLKTVASGGTPVPGPSSQEVTLSTVATRADMIMLKSLVEAKNFHLTDFGIKESSPPTKKVVEALIADLRQEK